MPASPARFTSGSRTASNGAWSSIKKGWSKDFTKDYGVERLVYFEMYGDVRNAIRREKQLKGWRCGKKVGLIEKLNPGWKDLAREWYESRGPSTRDRDEAAVARSG